jgi:spore coat polysaccharide biosynthesis protein SpsF
LSTQIFLQARLHSSRLPKKILKKINNKTILNLIHERLQFVDNVEKIILITGPKNNNQDLIEEANRIGIKYFCGNENNILDRFYSASKKFNSKNIIRITGDCPLIDYNLIKQGLDIYQKNNLTLLCNNLPRTFPHGMDYEILNTIHLEKSWNFYNNTKGKNKNSFINPVDDIFLNSSFYNVQSKINNSHIRLTLDYIEDFIVIKKIFEHLYHINNKFTLQDILKFIHTNPSILRINQKFQ